MSSVREKFRNKVRALEAQGIPLAMIDEALTAGTAGGQSALHVLDEVQRTVAVRRGKPGPWAGGYVRPEDLPREPRPKPREVANPPKQPEPEPVRSGVAGAWDRANYLARRALDAASFGYYSKGRDALVGMIDREGVERQKGLEEAAGRAPGMWLAGNAAEAAGMLAPALLTGAAGAGAARSLGLSPTSVPGAAVSGAVSGGMTAGAESAARGEGIREAAPAVGEGALLGGLLGGGTQALASGMSRGGRRIERRLRESDWVDEYLAAKAAGRLDDPEIQRLPKGEKGIQQAAIRGRERVMTRDEQLGREASAAYQGAEAAFPNLDELQLLDETHGKLDRLVKRYSNDRPIHPSVKKLVGNVKSNLSNVTRQDINPVLERDLQTNVRKYFDWKSGGPRPRFEPDPSRPGDQVVGFSSGEEIRTPAATNRDLLSQRRAIAQKARFTPGAAVDREAQAAREIYSDVDEIVKEAVPGLREADEAYTKFKRDRHRRGGILRVDFDNGGQPVSRPIDDPSPAELLDQEVPLTRQFSPADEVKAERMLKRVGDQNEPGLVAARHLQELADQDPEFAQAIDFIANKKAMEAVRFSLRGLIPTSLTGATHAAGFGPAVAQNKRALAARLAPVAGNAGQMTQAAAPVVAARARDLERERKRAKALKRDK